MFLIHLSYIEVAENSISGLKLLQNETDERPPSASKAGLLYTDKAPTSLGDTVKHCETHTEIYVN